jgi:anti-sigma regulatory factor (Ser/Thr protein kinase)
MAHTHTHTNLRIPVADDSQVGNARRAVTQRCEEAGLNEEFRGRAAIVATELARNLALHATGGQLLITLLDLGSGPILELITTDRGPGMRNVGECLRDGYSTAGTAGNGFGAIRRLSQDFEVYSQLGAGTVVWARLHSGNPPRPARIQVGAVSLACAPEPVCGDAWGCRELVDAARVTVSDGLGHGLFAHEAAESSLAIFRDTMAQPLERVLGTINEELTKTRGAAQAIVHIDFLENTVRAAGVGNISMRVIQHENSRSMVSENGILGAGARRIREYGYPWAPDAILILHSDGLSTNWGLQKYPALDQRHPAVIAAVLFRDHARERDDATIVVVRQTP